MIVGTEKVRTPNANRPIAKSGSFGGAGNDSDMLGHVVFDFKIGGMRVCQCGLASGPEFPLPGPFLARRPGKTVGFVTLPYPRKLHNNTERSRTALSPPASLPSPTVRPANSPGGCTRCWGKTSRSRPLSRGKTRLSPALVRRFGICCPPGNRRRRLRRKASRCRSLPPRATTTGCSPGGPTAANLRRFPHPGAGRATKPIAADSEAPSSPIRWVNQWDNFDGSIERGYAGRSIFFDNGHVRPDLTRVSEYGRLLASVGLNGATVNNVNSNLRTLEPEMILELARIADAFRPWGVRMSLVGRSFQSRRWSAT